MAAVDCERLLVLVFDGQKAARGMERRMNSWLLAMEWCEVKGGQARNKPLCWLREDSVNRTRSQEGSGHEFLSTHSAYLSKPRKEEADLTLTCELPL